MAAIVPVKRTETIIGDVVVGAPVRGQTWREMGMLLAWLRGHGMQLIPAHYPGLEISTSSSPESLYYRVKPQGLGIQRVWAITLRREESAATSAPEMTVTLPGSGVTTLIPGIHTGLGEGRYILTETVAKSSAEADLVLTFERVSGAVTVFVESVACWELPRAVLTLNATDYGVDFETLRPGAAIYDDVNQSLGAVCENLALATTQPRRMLLEQSFPAVESDPGGAGNPTAWVDIFVLPVPIFPRRVAVGATTFTITWNVYANVQGAGDTFEVRLTSGVNANTATITIAGVTTAAWASNSTLEVDCEDPAKEDGVPGTGQETIQVAVRRTAGTGKVTLRSVAAWEAS